MQWSLQDLVTCHAVMLHGTPVVLKSDEISSLRGCTQSIWDVYTSCNARLYLYSINESLSKLHELKHWQKRYKSSISRYLKGRVELNAPKNQRLSDNNIILEFLCTCNITYIDEQSTHETLHIPFLNIDNVDFVLSVSVRYLYYLSLNTS